MSDDDDGVTVRVGGREVDPVRGGALLLVLGLALSAYGGYDYHQQRDALDDAVEVNATVVETGVEATSGSSSPGAEYRPTVSFEYRYGGENYTSHSVFPSSSTPNYDTESAAREVLAGYEAGSEATAYVDPDQPADAFLLREASGGPLLAIGIGAALALLGAGAFLTGRRRR